MTETDTALGKGVLVTGASTGIGRACAIRLAQHGWRVFAGVRTDEAASSIEAAASGIRALNLEVTEASSIASAVDAIESDLGSGVPLGGIVNNAGVVVPGPLEFVPIDELRRQFEVNSIAPVAVAQAFMPMLRRSQGRVVNIGSISGKIATPMMGPYSASKFAVEALSDSMRTELAPFGIVVALVDPGNISTPIWQKSSTFAEELLPTMPPECREYYGDLIDATFEMARRSERESIPAERVARAVAHALSAKRPRTRYFVGSDAKLGSILARLAPDSLKDRLVRKVIGV